MTKLGFIDIQEQPMLLCALLVLKTDKTQKEDRKVLLVFADAQIHMQCAQSLLRLANDDLNTNSLPQSQEPVNFSELVTTEAGLYNFGIRKWEKQGRSGQSQSASILFLHGFLGQATDWDPVAAGLSLEGDCFAINLPGHGKSSFQAALNETNGTSPPNSGERQLNCYEHHDTLLFVSGSLLQARLMMYKLYLSGQKC